MEKSGNDGRKEPEIVYSRSVKAGKRIYYLDVKKARNEDLYVCITESKKKSQGESEPPTFEKHKVFLYKEDFAHFIEGLEDVIAYIKNEVGEIEDREEWNPQQDAAESQPYDESNEPAALPDDSAADDAGEEKKSRRFGFFHIK